MVVQLSDMLDEPKWMRDSRLDAFELYESLPMPTQKDEPWRRTDIRALRLNAIGPSVNCTGKPQLNLPSTKLEEHGGRLLQVDGQTMDYQFEELAQSNGVIFTDMSTAVREHGDLLQEHFMTKAVRPETGIFAALHAAFWRGGTFLYVPAGRELEAPLQSVLWAVGGKTFDHTLVVLERNAKVTLILEHASAGDKGQAFHNGVVELILGDGAQLQYLAVQEWGGNVWQFSHERALVGRDARLNWVTSVLGSRLTKAFQTVELDGA
jgi:Fe-S cluster assembly protein SufD